MDLSAFLVELGRVVRPGGRIGLLEVAEPSNSALRLGHNFYFTRVVPRIGAALSDGRAYRYLPRSVAYLPPVEELVASVAAAGFGDVERTDVVRRRRPDARGDEAVTLARRLTDARLVATTVPLDADVDLVDVVGRRRRAVGTGRWREPGRVGRGARLAVRLDEDSASTGVAAALGAIESDGPLPPVAVGALPFLRSEQRRDGDPGGAGPPPARRLVLADGHRLGPRHLRSTRSAGTR